MLLRILIDIKEAKPCHKRINTLVFSISFNLMEVLEENNKKAREYTH